MKKILLIFSVLAVFVACSKDNGGTLLTASMSAKISGADWKALAPAAVLNDGKFVLTGIALNGSSLTITILSDKTGDYALSAISAKCAAAYKKTATSSTDDGYVAITGKVNLSEVDNSSNRISGTYNFLLIHSITDTINITDGKFTSVKFTNTSGM